MHREPVRLERRASQRFEINLPVAVQFGDQTFAGFTQDVSGRGVFFYTEADLPEGSAVDLTFIMPSEITLAGNMRVRCCGQVLRCSNAAPGRQNGIAARLHSHQYFPLSGETPAAEFLRPAHSAHPLETPRPAPR